MRGLKNGNGRTTIFTNEKGKIIDAVDVYFLGRGFYIIHSQGTRESLLDLFKRYVIMEDISIHETKIFSTVLKMQGASNKKDIFTGDNGTIVMYSPRIYPDGQLYVSEDNLHKVFSLDGNNDLIDIKEYNVLRLEQSIPLFKYDFDENINPLETHLREFISLTKGCYIGQEVIARLDSYNKIKRFLKGVIVNPSSSESIDFKNLEQTGIKSGQIYNNGTLAGTITSIGYSMNFGSLLLMVRFERANERTGTDVELDFDGIRLTGKIVDLPFVRGKHHE